MKYLTNLAKTCFLITFTVFMIGCGGNDGGSSSESVSMSESGGENMQQSSESSRDRETRSRTRRSEQTNSRRRRRSRSSGGSVDAEQIFEKTNIYPTKLKTFSSGFGQLTLNNELTIKSIKLPGEKNNVVEWPTVPGDRDQEEDVVWFENFDLKKALDQKINSESVNQSDAPSLKITKMRANKYKDGSLRGFMDVTFNEALTVKGLKLMKSDGDYWIAWPSEKSDGEYFDLLGASKELKKRIKNQASQKMGY